MSRSISLSLVCLLLATACHASDPAPRTATPESHGGASRERQTQTQAPPAHSDPTPARSNGSSFEDQAEVAKGMNAFGAALYQRLRTHDGNLIWSPASVAIALDMAYGGARGATRSQMRSALHLGLDDARLHRAAGDLLSKWNAPNDGYTLDVANRVYADRSMTLLPSYVDLTRDRYGAPVEVLDMKGAPGPSASRINGWVSTETHGLIPEIISAPMLANDPLLVLVDAVYFKGQWGTPFERSETQNKPFTLAGGRQVQAPMMHVDDHFGYTALADGTKVLRMGYEGGMFEMVIALPANSDGLAALERNVNGSTVSAWVQQMEEPEVQVHLPRFRVAPRTPIQLGSDLQAMGMPLAFSNDADFSGISAAQRAKIGAVVHRAFVAVDEKGTVAAAATAVVMDTAGAAPPPSRVETFDADHPFLFFIRDDVSGAILFWGRLVDPTAH